MPLTIPAVQTELVPLVLELWTEEGEAASGLFPRAMVLARDGVTVVDTVDLPEGGPGQYQATWQVLGVDKYLVRFAVFSDAARTVLVTGFVFDEPDLIVSDQANEQPIIRASSVQPGLI